MFEAGKLRRRLAVQLLLVAVALLGFVGILAIELMRSYDREMQFATRHTAVLAQLLEENLGASVHKIDVALQAAAATVEDHDRGEGLPAAAINERLGRLLATIPEAFSLRIIDVDGAYRFDASGKTSPAKVGDRQYFTVHRDRADAGLYLSEPLFSRVVNEWTVVLSRRIGDRQGRFRGVAQASIKVAGLAALYAKLPLGPKDTVSLWTTGAVLAARYPDMPELIGKKLATGPLPAVAARGEHNGMFDTVSSNDGLRRIYSFHRVGELPYYIVVGRAWDDAFADWQRTAMLYAIFTLLLAVLSIRLILVWQRSYQQALQLAGEMSAAYADSSRRSRALLDSIPDSAWLKDRDGNLIALNETYANACGRSVDEVLSMNTRDLWPAEETRLFEAQENEVISGGQMRRYEYPIHLHDGRLRYWETFRTPVYDEAGGLVGTAGIARDITERRAADEERRLVAEVFGTSVEGIVITDADGRILQVNRAFTELTGYPQAEVIGQPVGVLRSARHDQAFVSNFWQELAEQGHWQGEIWYRRRGGEDFPTRSSVSTLRNGEGRMTHSIGVFTDISEQKAAEERIRHLAEHDYLTDLPNRLLFNNNLEYAIAYSQQQQVPVALLFIDLDRFKDVNDTLGHGIGDRLLQVLAARLRACVSEEDTVSRQGGDEFVILLMNCVGHHNVANVAERILATAAQPILLDEHELNITASIGISLCPGDGKDIQTLLSNADTALYQAKSAGRNNYQFFTADMQVRVQERLSIERDLRKAIGHNEFILHYQPQFDTASGRLVGVEALIRWRHPEQGMVPPLRFIGVAEESRLIRPIGNWVLQEACRQARRWQDDGMPALPVAVNVSAVQFHQDDLLQAVRQAVEAAGIAPACLELEITESVLMNDAEHVVGVIAALKAFGVSVAIDDFGTGYSSLAYLKRFRTDKIKIDQSFVRDVPQDGDDVAIVRAIIDIARNLNQRVVAEGVETGEQLDFLRQLGCPVVQGYYFSKPISAEDLFAHREWWAEATPLS